MLKNFLLYFLFYLKNCESTNSFIQLHFNYDKSYLIENLETNENDVTFKNIPVVTNLRDPLIDITCCFRMKLDFIYRQVCKFVNFMKDAKIVLDFLTKKRQSNQRIILRNNILKGFCLKILISEKITFSQFFFEMSVLPSSYFIKYYIIALNYI
jgi:hypothetical protein